MRALLLVALAGLSSCSLFKDEDKPEVSETKPSLVGRIASVPEGGDFVLIESYGTWRVPDGGMLTGIGTEGRASNLLATGEKLGQFSAADIRSGVAKVGDSVYFRPIKDDKPPGEFVETPSASQAPPATEPKTTTGDIPAKP
ncbi:hypothetical protein OKA04_00125 [Luteolibacter flavescens]|uniref:Lipoprotein n=1 Tax=Luteolibacter flavescens TaxID=1859460 RepID=A0ABT3FHR4_9BACT|nr:hypothetical protein [Luteolibacter flavescens]MCW1883112.1 hypothetical protein [Luteolibacter flavescens]